MKLVVVYSRLCATFHQCKAINIFFLVLMSLLYFDNFFQMKVY